MKIAHGENATHDRTVERHLVSKRAHYAFVEDRIAHEGRVAEARSKLAEANKAEAEAKQVLTNCKSAVKLAKANLLRLDVDLRSYRRAENSRLQAEAETLGAKTYHTGTPCRNGHFSERYTSSGACAMCDKIGWEGGKLKTTESHES